MGTTLRHCKFFSSYLLCDKFIITAFIRKSFLIVQGYNFNYGLIYDILNNYYILIIDIWDDWKEYIQIDQFKFM